MSGPAADVGSGRRRLLMLAPLGVAAAGGAAFWAMLSRMQTGAFDPHAIGNPMLGKPIPNFDLPGMGSAQGFSSGALKSAAAEHPVLVNFYASWCVPCAQEADILGTLAQQGLALWGIAYEDTQPNSDRFLARYGNPYARIANDAAGRVAIDFGVFGVPESYLIDRAGIIRWHMAGPLTDEIAGGQLQQALKAIS